MQFGILKQSRKNVHCRISRFTNFPHSLGQRMYRNGYSACTKEREIISWSFRHKYFGRTRALIACIAYVILKSI